jgi:hypothetical protein
MSGLVYRLPQLAEIGQGYFNMRVPVIGSAIQLNQVKSEIVEQVPLIADIEPELVTINREDEQPFTIEDNHYGLSHNRERILIQPIGGVALIPYKKGPHLWEVRPDPTCRFAGMLSTKGLEAFVNLVTSVALQKQRRLLAE